MKTTNYYDTFIETAEDCPVTIAEVPPQKGGEKTAAGTAFDMIKNHPYRYTSDEVLFRIYALKNGTSKEDAEAEKEKFFSKGQACFRASPLGKRYGWGIHYDGEGKMALYAVESDEYKRLSKDKNVKIIKAMRSKRG